MSWLYRILDVGRGVEIAVDDVMRIRRREAAYVALALDGLLAVLFLWVWWIYDLRSTWEWAAPLGQGWTSALPVWAQAYNQWLIFILNALPTLVQWRFPSLARRHAAYFWGFALAAVFDLITDYPAVSRDIDAFVVPVLQTAAGSFAPLLVWPAYFVGTIAASFVVQSLVAIQMTKTWCLIGRTVQLGEDDGAASGMPFGRRREGR